MKRGLQLLTLAPLIGCTDLLIKALGIGVGLLTYVIRTWGGYPDGLAFAVLLMNLCVTRLDRQGAPR